MKNNTNKPEGEVLNLTAYIGSEEFPKIFSDIDFHIRELQNEVENAVYDNLPSDVYAYLQEEDWDGTTEETKQKGDKILEEVDKIKDKIDLDINKMADEFMLNLKNYLSKIVIPRV